MKMVVILGSLVLGGLGLAGAAILEAASPSEPQPAANGGDTSSPNEEVKAREGTWSVTMTLPRAQPMETGVETRTLTCEGQWLVRDLKGNVLGKAVSGHGIFGYDQQKQRYVGAWVDSSTPGMIVAEGTRDPSAKTLSMVFEGPGAMGAKTKIKEVHEMKEAGTEVVTILAPGADGREAPMMTLTYKRKQG